MALSPRKFSQVPVATEFANDDHLVGWREGGTDQRWPAQLIAAYVIGEAVTTYVSLATVGEPSGVAPLDSNGKVPVAHLPAIAITNTFTVANQSAMLALDAETGDVAIRTDLHTSFILAGSDPTDLGDWEELLSPTGGVGSVNGMSGAVTLLLSHLSDTTSFGRSIANAANAAAVITLLGLGAGATAGTASTTAQGIVELATDAEVQAGTDTGRAVTPSGLTAKEATVANFRANFSDRILTTDIVWGAAAEVALSDGATIAVDFATFLNATVTLAGNRTLGSPSNIKPGQVGRIRIVQDATGNRTLTLHSDYKKEGGATLTLSTAANAEDYLYYDCIAANKVLVTLVKAVS